MPLSRRRQNTRSSGTAVQTFTIDQRRAQVATLRLSRLTLRQIAERLGVHHSTIAVDVRAIEEEWRERYAVDHEKLVSEEVAKLDLLEQRLFAEALTLRPEGDRRGRVKLGVVDRWLALAERRAKLLGLDRPVKIDLSGKVAFVDHLDARIDHLLGEMAVLDVEGTEVAPNGNGQHPEP